MTRTQWLAIACAAACAVVEATTARAQGTADRLSIVVRQSRLALSGGGEALSLFDQALTPGVDALALGIGGGEVRWRAWRSVQLVAGAEAGGRTVSTSSRIQLTGTDSPVRQQTTFSLQSVQYAGLEWTAWRWQRGTVERLRVGLTGGAGRATYRLHQWGQFVDATRMLSYADDYRSGGRGTFGFGGAQVEVPLHRGVALQGDLRRQFGSAPMSQDFATFDRIDLGGTRAGLGLVLTPSQWGRR